MKKITSLCSILLLVTVGAIAQNARMVLYEGFTSATCPPCAPTNAQVDPMLEQNKSKIIPIKYQTRIPSLGDPMYEQTKAEVDVRTTYYAVNSNPTARIDGKSNFFAGGTQSHPGYMNQSDIDNQSQVTTPFAITINHEFSAAYDSVFITASVSTAADATYLAGMLKLRVVLLEEVIEFEKAPSTNGEKTFNSVMRKMYPNASGTTLEDAWTTGKTVNFNFRYRVPTYIYDYSKLSVVAFIQNDANKNVEQAAISYPKLVMVDAAMDKPAINLINCVETVPQAYTLINAGQNALTSATIKYKMDALAEETVQWTGNLASGAKTTVDLPVTTLTSGKHTFTTTVTQSNGNTEVNKVNDVKKASFYVFLQAPLTALYLDFETTTVPEGFFINNPDGGSSWTRKTNSGAVLSKKGCFKMDFYNSPLGENDELYMPAVNMKGLNPVLYFSRAHAPYSAATTDALKIEVSTDCGATWNAIYEQESEYLATRAGTTSAYNSPLTEEFIEDEADLSSVATSENAIIRFVGISGNGNNLYIDQVSIGSRTAAVAGAIAGINTVEVYPNPANGAARLSFTAENAAKNTTYRLVNSLGAVSATKVINVVAGENVIDINTEGLAAGIYQIVLANETGVITEKLVVQ